MARFQCIEAGCPLRLAHVSVLLSPCFMWVREMGSYICTVCVFSYPVCVVSQSPGVYANTELGLSSYHTN